ncbi:PucR family transcriptional regulator [Dermabacteraceae bacterium CCM 9519]
MFAAMTVREMLDLPALSAARVISGQDNLEAKVQQLNVLEAPDLAPWLAPGTVLLTSYFALANCDDEELEQFISQMVEAKVSAIVIKLDRLVSEVPPEFLQPSRRYGMPVITVDKDVRYETIIMDTLLPMVNHKAGLLDRHYRMNLVLDRWRIGNHSLEETLSYFAELIGYQLTLENIPNRGLLTTLEEPLQQRVIEVKRHVSENFAGFSYDVQQVVERGGGTEISTRVVAPIELGTSPRCELIVHDAPQQSDEFLIVLEHLARHLHIELLNQRNIDNLMYFNRHNLVDELLTNTELTPRNLAAVTRALGLGVSPQYQVVQVTLLPPPDDSVADRAGVGMGDTYHRDTLRIRRHLSEHFPHSECHVTTHRVAMIVNLPRDGQPVTSAEVADCLPGDIVPYVAGISRVGTVKELPKLREQTQQVKDIQKVLRRYSDPMSYDELGIFKLFHSQELVENIEEFIPQKFVLLHREHPVLFETLVTYLEQGRNAHRCAQELVVHPKTVQYRLGRIQDLGLADLENVDETLQLLFAARVLRGR